MFKLTTFEKIGEKFNLNDDTIHKISEIYINDCKSYNNTLKYYNNRYRFVYNNDYHNHRIKMDLVDSEYKNCIRRFLNSEIRLDVINIRDYIRIYQIQIFSILYYDKTLDYFIKKNKFKKIIQFIISNKYHIYF